MRIAIHDCELEQMPNKTFPNFALMKISAWHKSKGDTVEWFIPFYRDCYDLVYSSSVFDFTSKPTSDYLPENTIYGGTGYGLYGKENDLPLEIDNMFPDYSIYPNCDYAIGFLTRGCINNCKYCVVPKKEGKIRPYSKWQDIVRRDTNKIHFMDNNVLSCEYGIQQLKELAETNYLIDFNQGLDIMLVTEEIVEILSKIKWDKYIRFSCDKKYQMPYFKNVVGWFKKYNIPLSKIFVYVLVQKDLTDADERVQYLHSLSPSINIYAQAERNELLGIRPNKEQLEFAQRYVYGRCYKKETWNEYKKRIWEMEKYERNIKTRQNICKGKM